MRIIIEVEEGKRAAVRHEPAAIEDQAVPSADLAARAAALGAVSAGPAPAEVLAEGATPFVGAPGTPETSPEKARDTAGDTSAGAAPEFATGSVHLDEVEAES